MERVLPRCRVLSNDACGSWVMVGVYPLQHWQDASGTLYTNDRATRPLNLPLQDPLPHYAQAAVDRRAVRDALVAQ